MSRGDLVQAWWAAGRDSGWFYGIVEKCGQNTMTIRWESGLRQRLRRGEHDIRPISDPEIRAEMRKKLAKD